MAQQASVQNAQQIALIAQEKYQQRHLWLERLLDKPLGIIVLLLAHIALAHVVRNYNSSIGLFHVVATFALGLYWAINSRFPPVYAAYAVAYIVGAEVMWRQNEFPTFWETGKYAVSIILLLSWVRAKSGKIYMANLIYILCLTPGVILALFQPISEIHTLLSFSLTGPFAIFVCILYFNDMILSRDQLRRIFIMLILPVAGIAGITTYRLSTLDITWTGDSNSEASGFGANQVSSALGLGWMVATFVVVMLWERRRFLLFVPLLITIPWFISQNFLTFSRAGLIGAMLGVTVALFHFIYIPNRRIIIVFASIIALSSLLFFFPALDNTTQGRLSIRYQVQNNETLDELSSGRERILEDEIRVFLENPITGAGVGLGRDFRNVFGGGIVSHTEYTRLLADHGVLGVLANIMMFLMWLRAYSKQKNPTARGIAAALVIWTAFYMVGAGTRTVAVAFTFGLSLALLTPNLNLEGKEVAEGEKPDDSEIPTINPKPKDKRWVPLDIPVMPLNG